MRRLGIFTQDEYIAFLNHDSDVSRSEGFFNHARVRLDFKDKFLIASLNQVDDTILPHDEIGLSEAAWKALDLKDGDEIHIQHPRPLNSLSHVRSKVFGNRLDRVQIDEIMDDVVARRYSAIHLSSFITACAASGLDAEEIIALTRSMAASGECLDWGAGEVADKHCIGGLPGNRTSPIVVAIVTACGLRMPKTSSRAITSPAGTADTMETLTKVDLDLNEMRKVVEQEGGCLVWGGRIKLSPADDIFIRTERALDIDSRGQLVASILSKKIAAGSTHLVLDIPVGPTAKVRSEKALQRLASDFEHVAAAIGMKARILRTDGTQPVGRGVGPALEAMDVLAVLKRHPSAPKDLRDRAILIAGTLLEFLGKAADGKGEAMAQTTLDSGRAWEKFQSICEAQGGLLDPPIAAHTRPVLSAKTGKIKKMDNRVITRVAKLAGAPGAKAAGLVLHHKVGDHVEAGEAMFTIHAETSGELSYALEFVEAGNGCFEVSEP